MNIDLVAIKKQIQEDFPMVCVHSGKNTLNNRYDMLVYLAVSDYVDMRIRESEHKAMDNINLSCEHWIEGKTTYTDLFKKAKKLIKRRAMRKALKRDIIQNILNSETKQNPIKQFFTYALSCFHAAFFLKLDNFD